MGKSRRFLGSSIAALLAASGLAVVGPVAPAGAVSGGTCAAISTFTVSLTCTVVAGETITFVVKGGNGSTAGDGGAGGAGGGRVGIDPGDPYQPGGAGGAGGVGGAGGAGAKVTGTWTNTTGATVTLTLTVGTTAGVFPEPNGAPGTPGSDSSGPPPAGGTGQNGRNGVAGGASKIELNGTQIVFAGGGTGGQGGTGGGGGGGGQLLGPGSNGSPGTAGAAGISGAPQPTPLPSGWSEMSTTTSEAVGITITSVVPDEPVTPIPSPTPTPPAFTG